MAAADVSRTLDGIQGCHSITVLREGDSVSISLHCLVSAEWSVERAHELSDQFETRLRERLQRVGRVTIHLEPTGEEDAGLAA